MGIFDRMGKVISSNVNALLDKAEDPRKSIELVVTEMREQIMLAKKEIASSIATEKQLERKVATLDADAEKWGKRAELALKADDETLAREALVQKKTIVADRDRAEALLAEARATTVRYKNDLKRMEQKHQEVDARKGIIAAQVQQAKAGGGAEGLGSKGGSSAFDEFRRMEDQLERKEAEVAAGREVEEALAGKDTGRMSNNELEAKFAALEHGGGGGAGGGGGEIDDELAALKKKIRIKS